MTVKILFIQKMNLSDTNVSDMSGSILLDNEYLSFYTDQKTGLYVSLEGPLIEPKVLTQIINKELIRSKYEPRITSESETLSADLF